MVSLFSMTRSKSAPLLRRHFRSSSNSEFSFFTSSSFGHLICTLISENQGLEKLRSISNLRKISGPAHMNFFSVDLSYFSVCHLNSFQIYTINIKKIQVTNWKKIKVYWKKIRSAGTEIFLRFEVDLNFSRPWFSEIKVHTACIGF